MAPGLRSGRTGHPEVGAGGAEPADGCPPRRTHAGGERRGAGSRWRAGTGAGGMLANCLLSVGMLSLLARCALASEDKTTYDVSGFVSLPSDPTVTAPSRPLADLPVVEEASSSVIHSDDGAESEGRGLRGQPAFSSVLTFLAGSIKHPPGLAQSRTSPTITRNENHTTQWPSDNSSQDTEMSFSPSSAGANRNVPTSSGLTPNLPHQHITAPQVVTMAPTLSETSRVPLMVENKSISLLSSSLSSSATASSSLSSPSSSTPFTASGLSLLLSVFSSPHSSSAEWSTEADLSHGRWIVSSSVAQRETLETLKSPRWTDNLTSASTAHSVVDLPTVTVRPLSSTPFPSHLPPREIVTSADNGNKKTTHSFNSSVDTIHRASGTPLRTIKPDVIEKPTNIKYSSFSASSIPVTTLYGATPVQQPGMSAVSVENQKTSSLFLSNQESYVDQRQLGASQNPTSALLSNHSKVFSAWSHVTEQRLKGAPHDVQGDKTVVDSPTFGLKSTADAIMSTIPSHVVNPSSSPAMTLQASQSYFPVSSETPPYKASLSEIAITEPTPIHSGVVSSEHASNPGDLLSAAGHGSPTAPVININYNQGKTAGAQLGSVSTPAHLSNSLSLARPQPGSIAASVLSSITRTGTPSSTSESFYLPSNGVKYAQELAAITQPEFAKGITQAHGGWKTLKTIFPPNSKTASLSSSPASPADLANYVTYKTEHQSLSNLPPSAYILPLFLSNASNQSNTGQSASSEVNLSDGPNALSRSQITPSSLFLIRSLSAIPHRFYKRSDLTPQSHKSDQTLIASTGIKTSPASDTHETRVSRSAWSFHSSVSPVYSPNKEYATVRDIKLYEKHAPTLFPSFITTKVFLMLKRGSDGSGKGFSADTSWPSLTFDAALDALKSVPRKGDVTPVGRYKQSSPPSWLEIIVTRKTNNFSRSQGTFTSASRDKSKFYVGRQTTVSSTPSFAATTSNNRPNSVETTKNAIFSFGTRLMAAYTKWKSVETAFKSTAFESQNASIGFDNSHLPTDGPTYKQPKLEDRQQSYVHLLNWTDPAVFISDPYSVQPTGTDHFGREYASFTHVKGSADDFLSPTTNDSVTSSQATSHNPPEVDDDSSDSPLTPPYNPALSLHSNTTDSVLERLTSSADLVASSVSFPLLSSSSSLLSSSSSAAAAASEPSALSLIGTTASQLSSKHKRSTNSVTSKASSSSSIMFSTPEPSALTFSGTSAPSVSSSSAPSVSSSSSSSSSPPPSSSLLSEPSSQPPSSLLTLSSSAPSSLSSSLSSAVALSPQSSSSLSSSPPLNIGAISSARPPMYPVSVTYPSPSLSLTSSRDAGHSNEVTETSVVLAETRTDESTTGTSRGRSTVPKEKEASLSPSQSVSIVLSAGPTVRTSQVSPLAPPRDTTTASVNLITTTSLASTAKTNDPSTPTPSLKATATTTQSTTTTTTTTASQPTFVTRRTTTTTTSKNQATRRTLSPPVPRTSPPRVGSTIFISPFTTTTEAPLQQCNITERMWVKTVVSIYVRRNRLDSIQRQNLRRGLSQGLRKALNDSSAQAQVETVFGSPNMTVAYHVTGGDVVYPPSVVLEGLDSYGRDKLIADLRQYLPMVTALPLPVALWRPSPALGFQLKTVLQFVGAGDDPRSCRFSQMMEQRLEKVFSEAQAKVLRTSSRLSVLMLSVSQAAGSPAVSLVYAVRNGTVYLNGTTASNLLGQLSAELVGYFLFYPPLIIAEPLEYHNLNTSIATRDFWVITVIQDVDNASLEGHYQSFASLMEQRLAELFVLAGQQGTRFRRAATEGSYTVQMVSIRRLSGLKNPAEMTYYVQHNGIPLPGTSAAKVLNTVDSQTMALTLGFFVQLQAEPVVKNPPNNLWIIAAVLAPIAVVTLIIIIITAVLCRKNKNDFKADAIGNLNPRAKMAYRRDVGYYHQPVQGFDYAKQHLGQQGGDEETLPATQDTLVMSLQIRDTSLSLEKALRQDGTANKKNLTTDIHKSRLPSEDGSVISNESEKLNSSRGLTVPKVTAQQKQTKEETRKRDDPYDSSSGSLQLLSIKPVVAQPNYSHPASSDRSQDSAVVNGEVNLALKQKSDIEHYRNKLRLKAKRKGYYDFPSSDTSSSRALAQRQRHGHERAAGEHGRPLEPDDERGSTYVKSHRRHSHVGQTAYRSRQSLSSPSPGGTEMDLLVMRERPRRGIRNSGYDTEPELIEETNVDRLMGPRGYLYGRGLKGHSETSTLSSQPSIDEVRQQMHLLLEEAFSLASGGQSTSGRHSHHHHPHSGLYSPAAPPLPYADVVTSAPGTMSCGRGGLQWIPAYGTDMYQCSLPKPAFRFTQLPDMAIGSPPPPLPPRTGPPPGTSLRRGTDLVLHQVNDSPFRVRPSSTSDVGPKGRSSDADMQTQHDSNPYGSTVRAALPAITAEQPVSNYSGNPITAVYAIPATRPSYSEYYVSTPPTSYHSPSWMSYPPEPEDVPPQWADSVPLPGYVEAFPHPRYPPGSPSRLPLQYSQAVEQAPAAPSTASQHSLPQAMKDMDSMPLSSLSTSALVQAIRQEVAKLAKQNDMFEF